MISSALDSILQPMLRPLTEAIGVRMYDGFSPISLFTASEKGYIYDNNDLSSFYLDSAGTTPATVNGLVGLQLDKSGNLALGADFCVNGGFTTDTNWTKGTGWAISGGVATKTPGSADTLQQAGSLTVGKAYKITYTVSGRTAGTCAAALFGGTTVFEALHGNNGARSCILIAVTGNITFGITANSTFDGSIDNYTIQELPGNHRYQTTTGNKPILRGTPVGSNFFTNGDGSTTTGWTTDGVSTLASVGGRLRLTKGAAGFGYAYKNFTTVIGSVYLIKWKAYTGTAGPYFSAGPNTGAGKTYVANKTTTGEAYFTATSTTAGVFLQVNDSTSNLTYAEFDDIEIFDVSADAVSAPYGLQYDGIDDFLTTASVDFTATDKATLVSGNRKLSDAATGVVASLGDVGATLGSFEFRAPFNAATANIGHGMRGSGGTTSATYSTFIAPVSLVVSFAMDYALGAGTEISARANGVALTPSGTDAGTGPFANAQMYFGRRGGASLPYNGLDFGGVCIGKSLTATQLANVEKWVSLRTGVTL